MAAFLAGAATGCGAAADQGPVELRLAPPSQAVVRTVTFQQEVDWGEARVGRRLAARYTMAPAATPGHAAVRLDSFAVMASTPHGRQTFDTRHLVGARFELDLAPGGGSPPFPPDAPVLDLGGMLEGEVRLERLLRYAFPALPDRPVAVGDRWTARGPRPEVEAHLTVVAEVETTYRLAGWERRAGAECALVEGRVRGEVDEVVERERGPATGFVGTIEGELSWCLDPETGTVVRLAGEERSDGRLVVNGRETPVRQTATIAIAPVGAARSP